MPYPSPIVTELNLLFETRRPISSKDSGTDSSASSPASSTSTLALDDDEIRDIFSTLKFLNEPAPATTPTPREELNPRAAPFVPTPRPQSTKPPQRRTKPASARRAPPPIWFDAFSRGVCASASPNHESYARVIVSACHSWPIEAMAELAQNFCWRGSERLSEESAGIAPFAFNVFLQFLEVHGEETAQSFVWHLRETVVGSFKNAWDPESSAAITYLHAPSFNYVASAIAQATFIGHLFAHELITGPHVATCIVTLIKGTNSYEHLEALRALISTAGPSFWHGTSDTPGQGNVAIHKFVATFLDAVAPLTANMSLLGRSLKPDDMHNIITEVERMVTGWVYDPARPPFEVDPRRTPTPILLSADTSRPTSADLKKKLFDPKRARK